MVYCALTWVMGEKGIGRSDVANERVGKRKPNVDFRQLGK